MERNHIDIRWNAIKVGHILWVSWIRFEAHVVRGEVPLELQVVVNDLLEDVFLHRQHRQLTGGPGALATYRL